MFKNEIDKRLVTIKNELSDMASLYDLHIIEVLNIFNYSLIETYKLNRSHYLVNFTLNNQIIFYHMFEHKEILYNLSKDKFNTFYKIFNTNISKKSETNMVALFYTSLNQQKYIELSIKGRTRRFLTLIPKETKGLYKYLTFKYSIKSKYDDDFIDKNNTFWITLTPKNLHHIKDIKIAKKSVILDCDIIDYNINKLLINHFLEKIALKTKNKINLRIKFYNHKNKIVNLICSEYIPILFIKYIENYIYINTNYRTNLVK